MVGPAGGGGVTVPPVVMVPAPEKLSVNVVPFSEPLPGMLGNDPVAPAQLPVPPVTVPAAVPLPVRMVASG